MAHGLPAGTHSDVSAHVALMLRQALEKLAALKAVTMIHASIIQQALYLAHLHPTNSLSCAWSKWMKPRLLALAMVQAAHLPTATSTSGWAAVTVQVQLHS